MINSLFIICKNFNEFSELKLSKSKEDNSYIIGPYGIELYEGEPDISYYTIVFIENPNCIWTHGALNNCSVDISYLDDIDKRLENKQDSLVSGVNIKTINNISLIGSGNIIIDAEQGIVSYDVIPTEGSDNLITSGGVYTAIQSVDSSLKKYTDDKIKIVDDRITQLHTDYVLFEASSPNYDNITLNDSLANYEYIEVFAQTSDNISLYTKVINPDKKTFFINHSSFISSGYHTCFKCYNADGNALSCVSEQSGSVETTRNDKHSINVNNGVIGIVKVIGYK